MEKLEMAVASENLQAVQSLPMGTLHSLILKAAIRDLEQIIDQLSQDLTSRKSMVGKLRDIKVVLEMMNK